MHKYKKKQVKHGSCIDGQTIVINPKAVPIIDKY